MQKPTMLCLLLTMTLVVAVKAQVNENCMGLFSDLVDDLETSDPTCYATLGRVADNSMVCTDDLKKAIDKCFNEHRSDLNDFLDRCDETVRILSTPPPASPSPADVPTEAPTEAPLASPTDVPTTPASPSPTDAPTTTTPTESPVPVTVSPLAAPAPAPEPLMEPATGMASTPEPEAEVPDVYWPASPTETPETDSWPQDSEISPEMTPASAPAPSPVASSPVAGEPEEASEPEEGSSIAPGPASSRRLSRRLLSDELEEEESDFEQLKRTLLESGSSTCRDLFIEGGAEAFRNNAASLKLSLLSIIGSILLGLMLI